MTKDFNLNEFIYSRFYSEANVQDEVIESYNNEPHVQKNLQILAEQLQVIRDHIGKPVRINIAYRPLWWEIERGRSGKSQHCLGKAADIVVGNMTSKELHDSIIELIESGKVINGGLGLYKTFVHYDIRDYPTRWQK